MLGPAVKDGFKYMFVSTRQLGASLDLSILTYFAQKDASFLMECCERTANIAKGRTLGSPKLDKQLILHESAMCADDDEEAFQDIKASFLQHEQSLDPLSTNSRRLSTRTAALFPFP
jgi:UDP-N-acetylglucosamine pyrophosphorylase